MEVSSGIETYGEPKIDCLRNKIDDRRAFLSKSKCQDGIRIHVGSEWLMNIDWLSSQSTFLCSLYSRRFPWDMIYFNVAANLYYVHKKDFSITQTESGYFPIFLQFSLNFGWIFVQHHWQNTKNDRKLEKPK